AKHKAVIRLAYVEGMDKESCPAIVCCGGRLDLHGAPLRRTWLKLGQDAKAGATAVKLVEPADGWRAGDRIVLTATNVHGPGKTQRSEERVIAKVDGDTLELTEPLEYDHVGSTDFRGEVANLSRNVVVESADPAGVRGHTMYHRGSA